MGTPEDAAAEKYFTNSNEDVYYCPKCCAECVRDEVDIGVGVQVGPWRSPECGYSDMDDAKLRFPELFDADIVIK
jgi:hypothetical protein